MTTTSPVHFGSPDLLVPVALGVTCLAALLVWEAVRRRRALASIATPEVRERLVATVSRPRRFLKRLALWAAAALTLIALTRPQWGVRWEETTRRGIELMFAVDTSRSMLARDLRPDRLTRSKLAIADLVRRFPSDRVGLVAFAGDAFLQVPMTLDRGVFLDALDALEPGVVPVGGSDLASAIRVADRAFTEADAAERVLILVSDGEDLTGDAIAAAAEAASHGVVIHTVGVGTPEGELLTVPDGRGGTTVVRDEAGEPVRSHLDEATLRAIAEATGGTTVPLGIDGSGLDTLYRTALADLERRELESRSRRIHVERYAWFLLPALVLLFLEPFVGERGRPRPLGRRLPLGPVAGLLLGVLASSAPAAAAVPGARAYNEGVAAYESGDWQAAADRFEGALGEAAPDLHPRIWYNLGSARYRQGEAIRDADVAATRRFWTEALQAFEAAVELDPDDEDAVYNRDFVAARLAELDEEEPPPDASDADCDNPGDAGNSDGNDGTSDDGQADGNDADGSDASGNDGTSDDADDGQADGNDADGSDGGQADGNDADGSDADGSGADGNDADGSDDGQADGNDGTSDDADDGRADGNDADGSDADGSGADGNDADGSDGGQADGGDDDGNEADGTADSEGPDGTAPAPSPALPAGTGGEPPLPAAGLAATAHEGEGLTPEQAAALIRAAAGDAATLPIFAPAPPEPTERTPIQDW